MKIGNGRTQKLLFFFGEVFLWMALVLTATIIADNSTYRYTMHLRKTERCFVEVKVFTIILLVEHLNVIDFFLNEMKPKPEKVTVQNYAAVNAPCKRMLKAVLPICKFYVSETRFRLFMLLSQSFSQKLMQ